MINKRLQDFKIVLASQSSRRQYLLKELGLDFEIITTDVQEDYPDNLKPAEIAEFLADKKAESFEVSRMEEKMIIVAADTIVSLDGEILGKPRNYEEALTMLKKLSGKRHDVITGVCIKSRDKKRLFHVISHVYFKELCDEEIDYYINNFSPYDKAGGYGIQEWIGYIGISRLEGSFFNVMGLPVKEVYEELLKNYSYLC
ncbi:MAG: septum formation protein Maf [Bacteroidales bacterium]|nr:septum formation protein Maf [Bacteroidales bacterium]